MKLVIFQKIKKSKFIKSLNGKKKNLCFYIWQGSNLKNLNLRSRDNNFPIKISLVIAIIKMQMD